MKTYINRSTGEIFAYESDGSQDLYIPMNLERLSDDELAEIRKSQDGNLSLDLALQIANEKRDELLGSAALVIAPLQDAVDIGVADKDKVARLLRWKQYRIAISQIDQQEGFPGLVEWPAEPD